MCEIAQQADAERARVFIDQFKSEYPDIYDFIADLVEMPAAQAVEVVTRRWPALIAIKFMPDHERLITFLQTEIKARR